MPTTSTIHRPSRLRAILAERCPQCRIGKVYDGFLSMHRICPVCGLKFEREPGYFLGSMYISYALAVLVIGLLMFMGALLLPTLSYLTIFFIAAVAFLPFVPFIFRYSRVIWMHFDRMIDPEPIDPSASSSHLNYGAAGRPLNGNGHDRHRNQ